MGFFSRICRLFALGCATAAALLTIGCSTSQPQRLEAEKDDRMRDIALEHFIAGSVLESKGDYATAIIEYQEALQYDRHPSILYAIAKAYLILDKTTLAAPFAKQAVDLEPENIDYLEQLADVYVKAMRYDSAAVIYEKILAKQPGDFHTAFQLAQIYSQTKPMQALALYQGIRDQVGDEWDVVYRIAELQNALGKFDSAAVTMEALLALDPGNVLLRTTIAEMHLNAKKYDRAREFFHDLRKREPKNYRFTISLAEVERLSGRWDSSVAIYSSLLDDDSVSTDVKLEIGEMFLQITLADTAKASLVVPYVRKLTESLPKEWRAHWSLGAIYFNMRQYERAIVPLEKSVELNPENLQAHEVLAQTFLNLERYDRARDVVEQVLARDENNADLLSLLGFIYNRMGDSERTIATLRRALGINPKQMDALSTLALTLDGGKRFQESDSLYEAAVKTYSEMPKKDATYFLLLNNFAYSLSERSLQLQRALEMSREAIEFEKTNSSYLDTYGWIHYQLKNYQEAFTYIKRAVDLRGEEGASGAALWDHLGDVYFRLGDVQNALNAWNKALQQDPANASVKEKISKRSL